MAHKTLKKYDLSPYYVLLECGNKNKGELKTSVLKLYMQSFKVYNLNKPFDNFLSIFDFKKVS